MHTDIHYNKTLTTIATIHYPTSRIITIMQNYINTGRDCLDVQKSFKHEGLSNWENVQHETIIPEFTFRSWNFVLIPMDDFKI